MRARCALPATIDIIHISFSYMTAARLCSAVAAVTIPLSSPAIVNDHHLAAALAHVHL